ncbi:hypothetical protein AA0121_g13348 [Alternaria tenuissima]|nr:hypothetical protein AA0121_g13348 [Alternaria tenuissima]
MTHDLISKSFQATGVWPMDADPVLQRFNNHLQQQDNEPGIGEQSYGNISHQLRKIFDAAVADKARFEAKRLSQGPHSLQVDNELLRLENAELRAEFDLMRSRPSKSTTLTTQEGDDWHGGAVFYSLKKLASERARAQDRSTGRSRLPITKKREKRKKKPAIERQERQKHLTGSALKKLREWLDNKRKLRRIASDNSALRN